MVNTNALSTVIDAKYLVFDPEGNPSVVWADLWQDEWEAEWDAGHIEIIDFRMKPPHRYIGNGLWDVLERV